MSEPITDIDIQRFSARAGVIKSAMLAISTPTEIPFLCVIISASMLRLVANHQTRRELLNMMIEQLNHWAFVPEEQPAKH